MHRLIPLMVGVLLCGCGDPSAKAPMLKVAVQRDNGTFVSRGQYRVFSGGQISASSDRNSKGEGVSQRLVVDKIADEGITLTIQFTDSSAEDWERQVLIPYGEETAFDLPDGTTLLASIKRQE